MGAHRDYVPIHTCCGSAKITPHKEDCPVSFPDGSLKPSDIMKYFTHNHLPDRLASFSEPFCELAEMLDATLPGGTEKAVALRKLLESKDAAVRSVVFDTMPERNEDN